MESNASVEEKIVKKAHPEYALSFEWKRRMSAGIEATIESYHSLLELAEDGMPMFPNFSPNSFAANLGSGKSYDERSFAQLTPHERNFLTTQLLRQLGVNPHSDMVDRYMYEDTALVPKEQLPYTTPEHVLVLQYRTNRKGVYLNEIIKHRETQDYVISPQDYRL